MYEEERLLGIIPARGGSRGLLDKNIRSCAGKPLIEWTIKAAAGSCYLDRVIVSTDSRRIASVAKQCCGDVPFLRPAELATDTAATLDAIRHAVAWLKAEGEVYEHVVLLQPTSPLRKTVDIDRAIEVYFKNGSGEGHTLVSVCRIDAKYALLMHRTGTGMLEFALPVDTFNPRRQSLPDCFLPNGAIYIGDLSCLKSSFYSDNTVMYEMPAERSVDVDQADDLLQAECILQAAVNDQSSA